MELVIFIGLFFMFAIYLMPVLGLGYKICEGVHKRALFAKAAMQIQVFSAAFLFLVSLALFADYFMQGILFEASSAFSAVSNLDFWKDFLLHLGLASFVLCLFCALSVRFPKLTFLYFVNGLGGILLVAGLAQWINFAAVFAVLQGNANGFAAYCLQVVSHFFALPSDVFMDNPYALLKNTQVFSYAATMFFFLSVFLYALYLVCILSIAVRNSMDYGRDYYIFVLNKYGRAIFSFSLLAFGLVLILLIGFQLPFQPAFAELLQKYFYSFFILKSASVVFAVLYFLFSIQLKKNFCLAAVPMQKKSSIYAAAVLDFVFNAFIFFLIVNCY